MIRTAGNPFGAVARMIAGKSPPAWLANRLKVLADALSGRRRTEASLPLRTEAAQRLDAIGGAASLLVDVLRGDELTALRYIEAKVPLKNIGATVEVLQQVATGASLAATDLRSRRGPDRAHIHAESLSSFAMCALIIMEAWALTHDEKRPTPHNRTAVKAADAYWIATGGIHPKDWHDKSQTAPKAGWRKHFEKAKRATDGERLQVRRVLRPREDRKTITKAARDGAAERLQAVSRRT